MTPTFSADARDGDHIAESPERLGAEVARLRDELEKARLQNDRLTRTLRDSDERFRALTEQSLVGIAIVEGTRIAYVNDRFAETFGYDRDDMLSVATVDMAAHSSRLRVTQFLRDSLAGRANSSVLEFEGLRRDGSTVHVELSGSRMEMGGRVYVICVANDVTTRKLADRKVQALSRRVGELAICDPLTGLYNRRFMEASLEREVVAAERSGNPLSLVVCDIDHFKAINDAFGHQSGDEVLKAFASLLKRRCRRSDIACRYGGEEFLLVFPGMPADIATTWAEKLRTAIAGARVAKGASSLNVTASIGVATYPVNARSWHDLIAAADKAQYMAKAAGGDQVVAAVPAGGPPVADPSILAARAG